MKQVYYNQITRVHRTYIPFGDPGFEQWLTPSPTISLNSRKARFLDPKQEDRCN